MSVEWERDSTALKQSCFAFSVTLMIVSSIYYLFNIDNLDTVLWIFIAFFVLAALAAVYALSEESPISSKDLKYTGILLIILPVLMFTLFLFSWNPVSLDEWEPFKLLSLLAVPAGVIYVFLSSKASAENPS